MGEVPPTPLVEVKVVIIVIVALLLDFFFHGQLRNEFSLFFSIIVEDDGLLLCGFCVLPPKENLQALFWDAPPSSLIDLTTSPRWKQRKDKELEHAP